jgi:hypothetical protein
MNGNNAATDSLLLVHSTSAPIDGTMTTKSVGGEQEAASSTTTSNNIFSNAVLGMGLKVNRIRK